MQQETDYLVVGCGASAMTFVDVMLRETKATFTIIDKHHAPGGHWNDAYPFVKLHQPSASYGVMSQTLGKGRIDETGFNAGYYELASGVEVLRHFHVAMEDVFLPSGRVSYHPMSEYLGDGIYASLLSGKKERITIKKKLIDATQLQTSVPLTHERKFEVSEGVPVIPPNHLPRLATDHHHFMILGGGKTGIDTVCWLLAQGTPPDAISWVIPRDPWMLNRESYQPGESFFFGSIGRHANFLEIGATSQSIKEVCERLEKDAYLFRLDPNVWPEMMHGATVTVRDLDHMRMIKNIIRLGHVKHIKPDQVILEKGNIASVENTLYIDCTARAISKESYDDHPVFGPDKISLKMIRLYQPCFSSALTAHLEAGDYDREEKKRMTQPTPMTDTIEDWLTVFITSMTNGYFWGQNPAIKTWLADCRLDGFGKSMRLVQPDDLEKIAVLERMTELSPPAMQNLTKLLAVA
ncbi:MAG: hypothetical protein COA84_03705 [Robiginitomaculum sp.]|nr:MAG: hypothetical protein COA84_03705 [Robiginitomaculum sp.]